MAAKKKSGKRFDLRCPDCDFVAAHPMGLGRHRSTRHGTISQRQSRVVDGAPGGTGAWITRQQAADRAGVHYNTVRQWERTGVLRRGSRPGARETLVSAADVAKLGATRGGRTAGVGLGAEDAIRLAALESAQRDLADGLERLAAALRAGIAAPARVKPGRKPGRPAKAEATPKANTQPRKKVKTAVRKKKAAATKPTRATSRRPASRAKSTRRRTR